VSIIILAVVAAVVLLVSVVVALVVVIVVRLDLDIVVLAGIEFLFVCPLDSAWTEDTEFLDNVLLSDVPW